MAVSTATPTTTGTNQPATVSALPALLRRRYQRRHDPSPARVRQYSARVAQYYVHLIDYFGGSKPARAIKMDDLEAYVDFRTEQGAKASTVRSEVCALGSGIKLALGYAPLLPVIGVKNTRKGFLTGAQLAALLPHLQDYMRPFVETAYITGWRRGELANLTWSKIDWERGVVVLEPGTTKNDDGREFPIAAHPRLEELLLEQRELVSALEKVTGRLCPWVFPGPHGSRISWFYDGWGTACKKVGMEGRLFHDLRRSAVRNLIDAGVPQSVAKTITGHKTDSVFKRYEIRDGADVREAVKKLAAFHAANTPAVAKVLAIGNSADSSEAGSSTPASTPEPKTFRIPRIFGGSNPVGDASTRASTALPRGHWVSLLGGP